MIGIRSVYVAIATCSCVIGACVAAHAAGVEEIVNYREYSDALSSSGQPTEAQLQALLSGENSLFDTQIRYLRNIGKTRGIENQTITLGEEFLNLSAEIFNQATRDTNQAAINLAFNISLLIPRRQLLLRETLCRFFKCFLLICPIYSHGYLTLNQS